MQENLTNIFGSETKTSPRSSVFFVFVDFRKHSENNTFLSMFFFCNHVLGVTHILHTLDTYIYKYDTVQSKKMNLRATKHCKCQCIPGKYSAFGDHMYMPADPKPRQCFCVFAFVFQVLCNGLLRYKLYTCPNL